MFSKNLDGDDCGKLRWLDASSGAHGVTRPTTRGLAMVRWVIVRCGFKMKNVLFQGFSSKKPWASGDSGNLGWLDANSGAHGVTRPTTRGLTMVRWVIVGCGFKM